MSVDDLRLVFQDLSCKGSRQDANTPGGREGGMFRIVTALTLQDVPLEERFILLDLGKESNLNT